MSFSSVASHTLNILNNKRTHTPFLAEEIQCSAFSKSHNSQHINFRPTQHY